MARKLKPGASQPPAIHLDFETFSEVDLKELGLFRYAEDPSTEILILAYRVGDGPVISVDMTKPDPYNQPDLNELYKWISRRSTVTAHNAQFERAIWEKVGRFPVTPSRWDCTAARARVLALPGALGNLAEALGLDERKDAEGDRLIKLFSKPQKGGGRVFSEDRPEDFQRFMQYCETDVRVECELDKILPPLPPVEKQMWDLDYVINQRGLPVNVDLVDKALEFVQSHTETLIKECVRISGYRPTQRDKTLRFLASSGFPLPNLQAATVEKLALDPSLPEDLKALLDYRIELSRAGTKKLVTLRSSVSPDGRLRGSFLFSAASTRRWSSTGVQVHNLQKPEEGCDPIEVLSLLDRFGGLDLFYDRPLSWIAGSIRGFFETTGSKYLQVADYSAVEPTGLAWVSDEKWMLDAYRKKQDLYRMTIAKVYGLPDWTKIPKDSLERFIGKQLVLGCGYGMGPPRFQGTCLQYGTAISERESQKAVYGYRESVPNIVRFWKMVNRMCIRAVRAGNTLYHGKLAFRPETLPNGYQLLFIDMPSGSICYPNPWVEDQFKFGQMMPTFCFYKNLGSKFIPTDTFGGSITENIVQALTRDILRDGLLAAEDSGHCVIGHVHDEAIAEGDNNPNDFEDFQRCLSQSSPWASGFPITTEGYIGRRYKK